MTDALSAEEKLPTDALAETELLTVTDELNELVAVPDTDLLGDADTLGLPD